MGFAYTRKSVGEFGETVIVHLNSHIDSDIIYTDKSV